MKLLGSRRMLLLVHQVGHLERQSALRLVGDILAQRVAHVAQRVILANLKIIRSLVACGTPVGTLRMLGLLATWEPVFGAIGAPSEPAAGAAFGA